MTEIPATLDRHRPTGLAEMDRVLSGGLVPGSVTLVGGEPGIGKSTLLLQLAAAVAGGGGSVLYCSAEESAAQLRARAARLGALHDRLAVLADQTVERIAAAAQSLRPDVTVVDSVQAVQMLDRPAAPGSVSQVRDAAAHLVEMAKREALSVVLVGHVTKDGALAGPRQLEHLVDTVIAFEGDRHHALRQVRAVKHRFGGTNELGLFEMTTSGLRVVTDASGRFLADRPVGQAGSVVVAAMEGRRPLLVEVQALVAPSGPSPRRTAEGLDGGRLALLLAVLERRLGLVVANRDVFTLAVGGVSLDEPAVDLALAVALASSSLDRPCHPDAVVFGEVGLGGEVRGVTHVERRLGEAARLGFSCAVVPHSAARAQVPAGMRLVPVRSVAEALVGSGVATPACGATGPGSVAGSAGRLRAS
jgi:DNA repair protein RadA/Sms